jgi:hypothetical protein
VTYFAATGVERSLRFSDQGAAMGQVDFSQAGLAHAMARFPGSSKDLRRLALSDPEFRGLCEDYALAKQSLARFEARPDAAERPEVADYRSVIAELELEFDRFMKDAGVRG